MTWDPWDIFDNSVRVLLAIGLTLIGISLCIWVLDGAANDSDDDTSPEWAEDYVHDLDLYGGKIYYYGDKIYVLTVEITMKVTADDTEIRVFDGSHKVWVVQWDKVFSIETNDEASAIMITRL